MESKQPANGESPRFRVLVLGPFGLERDGIAVDTSAWQRRVATLFKLLAIAPERQRLRDDLVDTLWPDAAPETGAGNLRMLVHRLRLALDAGDPSPVLSQNNWVMLNSAYGWELDLELLESLVGAAGADIAGLEHAASLYRGEPLVEDRYEDWAIPLRERAQRIRRELCLRLGSVHQARGSYDDALAWYARLLEDDPIDEEAMRGVLETLRKAGRPAEALRRFQGFERRLQEEMGVPPSADLAALAMGIRVQIEQGTAPSGGGEEEPLPLGRFLGAIPEGPIVGREGELERAFFTVDAVEGGAGRLLLLAGEAGVGKTRVAQEIMLRLHDRGFLVAAGRCYARRQTVLYYPFMDLLSRVYAGAPPGIRSRARDRWPQLAWLLPEEIGGGPGAEAPDTKAEEPDEQRALFRAVAEFLSAVALERPLALLLDDLQWADDGSLDLLHHLARQTRGHRVLLLGAYRDGDISREHPVGQAVRELAREGLLERIAVPRLPEEGTAALVAATLGHAPETDEFSEFVHRRTKGNPFFVERMVRALGGRYRLIRQIGAGGMGRVFEATDIETGKRVAAKIMFARTEADPRAMLRFQQEAKTLAALRHPNIVKIYGTFVEEHAGCIIMELLEGSSLGQLLHDAEGHPDGAEQFSLFRIRNLMRQVAAALVCAHEHGVAHRDIKPDNIMVDEHDHVTVTDFGVARLLRPRAGVASLTSTGMTMGTPLYMSPEQIEGKEVDGRADIYSLGAVMYELATGRSPFEGDDPLSVAFKHVHEAPVPPRALNPLLPEDWEALILRALAKDRAGRFQTAVAMERAISALSPRDGAAGRLLPTAAEGQPGTLLAPAGAGAAGPPARMEAIHVPADGAGYGGEQPRARRKRRRTLIGSGAAAVAAAVVALLLLVQAGVPLPGAASGGGVATHGLTTHTLTGLAIGPHGSIYAVAPANDQIDEFSPVDGKLIDRIGSKGNGNLQFDSPRDVSVAPDGTVYVSDTRNQRVLVLRGHQELHEIDFNGGALAVDGQGRLYATDYGNYQIGRYSRQWSPLDPIPVPDIAGRYPFPAGIAVDPSGPIYLADRVNNQIVELSLTWGNLSTIGSFGHGPGQFDTPTDVALDDKGYIYVADAGNNRIEKFAPDGTFLRQWGTFGSKPGQFNSPSSVAVDHQGNIYVTDFYNNRIQKLSPSGKPVWATG